MFMIEVLFFGPLAEITGSASVQLQDCADTEQLQELLFARYPELRSRQYALAVNKSVVQSPATLAAGYVVAFLPPFSGG